MIACAFRGASVACGGFGCASNSATTFHVLYRLQVTNFSFLKSAPNGVNYIDIRHLFPHGHC
jgi:acyl CoA:acetate/3-ketoacid CoA transferase alpha subunit